MTTPHDDLPVRLREVIARGVESDSGHLPVRRVWPADLGDPSAGYVLECATPDGAVAAVLDCGGCRTLSDDEIAATLPALARWRTDGGRVLAHRGLKRAVLTLPDGTFVKLAKKSATRRALARAEAVEDLLGGLAVDAGAPLRPPLLGSDSRDGWLRLGRAPGIALDRILAEGPARLVEQSADSVARALAALAGVRAACNDGLPHELPVHTGEQEAAILRSWAAAAAAGAPEGALSPEQKATLVEQATEVADRLEQHPDLRAEGLDRAVLAHRDLHEGQILVDAPTTPTQTRTPAQAQTRVTFLDWDTAAWTHPALDVANLLAHVRRAQALEPEHGPGHAREFEKQLVSRLSDLSHPAVATPEALEALVLLRRAARLRVFAVHALRPGRLDLAALTPGCDAG
ncbi:MAG: phosphotransferase [Dermatophilus congolensis]|nr:phosphotransferase [Dermatophilus congolensis]